MKVITKDFQILEGENTFNFNKGINMVVGPNGSGKSSLFYAIENCLTNPNGVSDCINYNKEEAEVRIETNNESISWIRTLDSSKYRNNKSKKDYIKASKLDSRDIADLGFYFDKKNHVVNIHDEWSILFPFGESDSEMFRLFEDIFNISCSFLVIDEMKKDEQSIKSSIVQNQQQKAEMNDRMKKLTEIKEKVKVDDIDHYFNLVNEKSQQASELRKDYENFSKSALLSNVVLPEVFDVSKLYETSNKYDTISVDYNTYIKAKERSSINIPKIDISFDKQPPTQLKQDYNQYLTLKQNIENNDIELNTVKEQLKILNEQLSKIRICPTCGRPME